MLRGHPINKWKYIINKILAFTFLNIKMFNLFLYLSLQKEQQCTLMCVYSEVRLRLNEIIPRLITV